MRKIITIALLLATFGVLGGCADENVRDYQGLEAESLDSWMERYRPDLKQNLQEGGYYVDVLNAGDPAQPVSDTVYWVRMDFTGRDLRGNICLTRDEYTARQVGSFTKKTHYVPFYRYCGDEEANLPDGVHLALRNTLKLDADYAAERGLEQELQLGVGAEVVLYMPSSIAGSTSGSGGYEGQTFNGTTYTLSSSRPMIIHTRLLERVKNPLEAEGNEVDAFGEQNGGVKPVEKSEESEGESETTTRGAEEPQYNDGYAWRNAVDTLPQLYVNHTYRPTVDRAKLLKWRNAYSSTTAPYNDLQGLDVKINEALLERFGEGHLDGDSITYEGTARVWYIGRFLDGFIFDTNIDEVKKLIYGEVESSGSYISVTPDEDSDSYVDSWIYAIQQLRYGQWAAIVGTSLYNYGATGQAGETTTSTTYDSSYYDMLNYYNYMNSYYGNSYMGGYYGGYYDYYNYGYYNSYNNYQSDYTATTTTSTSTEIQSYTPLLFQIYIEEQ